MMKNSPALSVLVIDDEPLIRWSLAETLAECGHSVREASDGASAVQELCDARGSFDVIVLDYRLPDSNDLHLLETIRGLAPRAAVIMMTAYATPEMTSGALALGVYRVVAKPLEMHDFVALVAKAHGACPGT